MERRKVAELYFASDLFVLCSRVEELSSCHARSNGLSSPHTISTPCFGVQEQLENGTSALFYEAGNIAQLAAHITALCSDKIMRCRMAEAAHERLSALNSYEQMVAAYEDIYARVFGNGEDISSKNIL